MIAPINNTDKITEIFSGIFRKKNYQLKLWISEADFQLYIRTRGCIARYTSGKDIVSEIIAGVISGRIIWDIERVPNINTFMYHQIRSFVSNIAKKEFHKLYNNDCYETTLSRIYSEPDNIPEEEDVYKQMDCGEIKNRFLRYISDDPVAAAVFQESLQGAKNIEIAAVLSITVSEVENARKRIKRHIKKFRKTNLE